MMQKEYFLYCPINYPLLNSTSAVHFIFLKNILYFYLNMINGNFINLKFNTLKT